MSQFLAPALHTLTPYAPGEQPKGMGQLIKLNTNESPYPPAPGVASLVRADIPNLRLYSDPQCTALVNALADTYDVAPAQVFPSNGSDETLAFCFQAFCPNGAVFPDLTYGFYPVFADLYGVPYETIPLQPDFSVAIEDYRDKAGTVFIANPNAPTGLALPRAQIRALLEQNPSRLVVVDEAYIDFGGESAVPLLSEYQNLLVVQTFSKSRALAGARLGFALGSEALVRDLNTVRFSFNPYNVNRLTLLAGVAALEDVAYFNRCRQAICATRDRCATQLKALGFSLTDSAANFLFATPPTMGGSDYCAALRQQNILVRHFNLPRICNYVRITVGTPTEMDKLIQVTKECLP